MYLVPRKRALEGPLVSPDQLSQPEIVSPKKNPTVAAAVEAAVARNQELQRQELQVRAQQDEREKQLGLYRYSCGELLEQLNPVIEQFNQEFQHGQIARRHHPQTRHNFDGADALRLLDEV